MVPSPDPVPSAEVAGSVDHLVEALVPEGSSTSQRRLFRSMVETVAALAADGTEVVDLKVADSALAEMAEAFRVFRPFRRERKVTIFGSARTQPDHPAYGAARDLAATMAGADWMVVTGAGPGIMAAGMEGAGACEPSNVPPCRPPTYAQEDPAPIDGSDECRIGGSYFRRY